MTPADLRLRMTSATDLVDLHQLLDDIDRLALDLDPDLPTHAILIKSLAHMQKRTLKRIQTLTQPPLPGATE
jgi:hypothetical protein